MDYEESSNAYTPRTVKKQSSLKKLTVLSKAIRKRLPKTPKSERTTGSLEGSDSGTSKPRESFTSRIKKRFSGRSQDSHRRSFSASDLTSLEHSAEPHRGYSLQHQEEEEEEEERPLTLVTETIVDNQEDTIKKATVPTAISPANLSTESVDSESILHPDTPVPDDRELKQSLNADARSSSSQRHASLAEDGAEVETKVGEIQEIGESAEKEAAMMEIEPVIEKDESKEMVHQNLPENLQNAYLQYYEQGMQIIEFEDKMEIDQEAQKEENTEVLTDAAAAIDIGIKEAVQESFEQAKAFGGEITSEIVKESDAEEEDVEDEKKKDEPISIKNRDMDLGSVVAPTQEIGPTVNDEIESQNKADNTVEKKKEEEAKEIVKPKKRRFRGFRLRQASLSLATIAVGLLLLVLKSKA